MPEPQQKNQNYTPVNGGFAGYPNMYPGLVQYGTMSPKEVGANIKKALPFALGLGAAVGTGRVALPAVFGDMVGAAAADIPVLTIAGAGKAAMPVAAGAGTTYMTKEGFPKLIQTYKDWFKELINKKKVNENIPEEKRNGGNMNYLVMFRSGGIAYAQDPTAQSLEPITEEYDNDWKGQIRKTHLSGADYNHSVYGQYPRRLGRNWGNDLAYYEKRANEGDEFFKNKVNGMVYNSVDDYTPQFISQGVMGWNAQKKIYTSMKSIPVWNDPNDHNKGIGFYEVPEFAVKMKRTIQPQQPTETPKPKETPKPVKQPTIKPQIPQTEETKPEPEVSTVTEIPHLEGMNNNFGMANDSTTPMNQMQTRTVNAGNSSSSNIFGTETTSGNEATNTYYPKQTAQTTSPSLVSKAKNLAKSAINYLGLFGKKNNG